MLSPINQTHDPAARRRSRNDKAGGNFKQILGATNPQHRGTRLDLVVSLREAGVDSTDAVVQIPSKRAAQRRTHGVLAPKGIAMESGPHHGLTPVRDRHGTNSPCLIWAGLCVLRVEMSTEIQAKVTSGRHHACPIAF